MNDACIAAFLIDSHNSYLHMQYSASKLLSRNLSICQLYLINEEISDNLHNSVVNMSLIDDGVVVG